MGVEGQWLPRRSHSYFDLLPSREESSGLLPWAAHGFMGAFEALTQ
jgi:hypothetical protein